MGSITVEDSDLFFVLWLLHVDQFTFYSCYRINSLLNNIWLLEVRYSELTPTDQRLNLI